MMHSLLIADPDPSFRQQITRFFEPYAHQFELILASDGPSVVRVLKSRHVDIILSELLLPRLDGYELLDFAARYFPDVPVVVASEHGKPKTAEILKGKGAAGYFLKPVNLSDLYRLMLALVDRMTSGGILKEASLDTFTQMVEMELKTCTIRATDPRFPRVRCSRLQPGRTLAGKASRKDGRRCRI